MAAEVYRTTPRAIAPMRVHWLQHAEHEGLGCIEPWLRTRGFQLSHTALHRGQRPPAAGSFDWLIVMGGPMNIYEEAEYPWLAAEKRLINDACVTNKRILGICLGAQLLADVLGGRVTKNEETEIGWFDVEFDTKADRSHLFDDFPARFTAFHWHGDTFEVPPGAVNLMRSAGCARQAYVWNGGQGVGLQFHLEVGHADAQRWFEGEPPAPGRFVQSAAEILGDPERFAENNRLMVALLERMAARR